MYKYLVVDGMFRGTGIRNYYEGGYIQPEKLRLSNDVVVKLANWLKKYEEAFYSNYVDEALVEELDNEGIDIAKSIKAQIEGKVSYYSDAKQTKQEI